MQLGLRPPYAVAPFWFMGMPLHRTPYALAPDRWWVVCCGVVQELLDKRGHFQVPYLEDPNQGVFLFESSAIVKYLEDMYAGSNS